MERIFTPASSLGAAGIAGRPAALPYPVQMKEKAEEPFCVPLPQTVGPIHRRRVDSPGAFPRRAGSEYTSSISVCRYKDQSR